MPKNMCSILMVPRRCLKGRSVSVAAPVSWEKALVAAGEFREMTKKMVFNRRAMEDAILYFVQKANNEHLGRMKLMKLLYFADFDHYERVGESITGAAYKKYPYGPVPEQAFHVIDYMVRVGRLSQNEVLVGPLAQTRYALVGDPKPRFTADQFATLEAVVSEWKNVPSEIIVRAAHDQPPWNGVRDREIIPYHLAYYRNRCGEMDLEDDELRALSGGAKEWE